MSAAFERGHLLLQQGRHDLAERELKQALSADPDHALAHAEYAVCLLQRDAKADALREASEAVRLAPNLSFHHYVMSIALERNGRPKEAEAAARQALELDPHDAANFGQLASLALVGGKPALALEYADQGLACEPDNTWCANLRAMALIRLNRKDEAAASLGSALNEDPENAVTHANQGWTCLHQGNYKQAQVHFREALRLRPELEWARHGLKESLKARYIFYRVVLNFTLWLTRQKGWVQIGVLIALVFGQRLLRTVGEAFPTLSPALSLLAVAVIGFILLSWVADPLANFLLQFHPLGRLALTREERIESLVIGTLFVAAVAGVVAHFAFGFENGLILAACFGLLIFPVSTLFRITHPVGRLAMGLAIGFMLYLVYPMMMLVLTDQLEIPIAQAPQSLRQALDQWKLFVNVAIGSSWLPLVMGSQRWIRN